MLWSKGTLICQNGGLAHWTPTFHFIHSLTKAHTIPSLLVSSHFEYSIIRMLNFFSGSWCARRWKRWRSIKWRIQLCWFSTWCFGNKEFSIFSHCIAKGPFLNDIMEIWAFFDPLPLLSRPWALGPLPWCHTLPYPPPHFFHDVIINGP